MLFCRALWHLFGRRRRGDHQRRHGLRRPRHPDPLEIHHPAGLRCGFVQRQRCPVHRARVPVQPSVSIIIEFSNASSSLCMCLVVVVRPYVRTYVVTKMGDTLGSTSLKGRGWSYSGVQVRVVASFVALSVVDAPVKCDMSFVHAHIEGRLQNERNDRYSRGGGQHRTNSAAQVSPTAV